MARSIIRNSLKRPAERCQAQLPTEEKVHHDKTRDELSAPLPRPASGRTTALGRRVEKPGSGAPGGPSGQQDKCEHDRKHANK